MLEKLVIIYENKEYSADELKKMLADETDKLRMSANTEPQTDNALSFIIRTEAALSLGRDIAYAPGMPPADRRNIEKWLDFNRQVLAGKNIREVYIEDSSEVLHTLVWMAGLSEGCRVTVSEEPQRAGLAVVSLASLASGKIALSDYKAVISTGILPVDFNRLKAEAKDTMWVNYYAMPCCFCVSFASGTDLAGNAGIYHQLKPVAGFSAYPSDKNGRPVPRNISGYLSQECDSREIHSIVRCTMTSDSRLFAQGSSDEAVYSEGRYFLAAELENEVLRSGLADSCAVRGGIVFYSPCGVCNDYRLKNILSSAGAEMLYFCAIPFKAEHGKFRNIGDDIFRAHEELKRLLENSCTDDWYSFIELTGYENSALAAIELFVAGESGVSGIIRPVTERFRVNIYRTDSIPRYSSSVEDVDIPRLKKFSVPEENEPELTETELKMTGIWNDVLGISGTGPDDNFFDLGGNSFSLIRLAYEIEQAFGVTDAMQDVMYFSTLRKLSENIDNRSRDNVREQFRDKIAQIEKDIVPEPDIESKAAAAGKRNVHGSILIVGAVSVQCVYVLAGLIDKYGDREICFMSDSGTEEALKERMEHFGFKAQSGYAGLHFVRTDHTAEYFGLSKAEYDRLADSVSVVYDFGINNNLVSSYEVLRKKNIAGTNRLLEFCCEKRMKKLIFISSTAVFNTISGSDIPLVTEKSVWGTEALIDRSGNDYLYSVFAADKLVQNAAELGIESAIIRTGRVMGDSGNGAIDEEDTFMQGFRFMLHNRIVPSSENAVNAYEFFIPVDKYAEQIIALADIDESEKCAVYHIKGLEVPLDELSGWLLEKLGNAENVRRIDLNELVDTIRSAPGTEDNRIMASLQAHLLVNSDNSTVTSLSDDKYTLSVLEKSGIDTQSYRNSREMLDITYNYLNSRHYFE